MQLQQSAIGQQAAGLLGTMTREIHTSQQEVVFDLHGWLMKILIVEEFEDAVPFISISLLFVVFAFWAWGRQRAPQPTTRAARSTDRALIWLGTLVVTSAVLLVVQGAL